MSALAIQTGLLAAATTPISHNTSGDAGSSAAFADALTGFDKSGPGEKSPKSHPSDMKDAPSSDAAANVQSSGTDAPNPTQALAAALAALASSAGQGAYASYEGGTDPKAQGASGNSGPRVRLPLGPLAICAPPASATSTLLSTIETTGVDAMPAVFDLTGAVPLQRQLSADPTLGFQSLQARTHLAVADALPIRVRSPTLVGATVSGAPPASQPPLIYDNASLSSVAGDLNDPTASTTVESTRAGNQNWKFAANSGTWTQTPTADMTSAAISSRDSLRATIAPSSSRSPASVAGASHSHELNPGRQTESSATNWTDQDPSAAGGRGEQRSSGAVARGASDSARTEGAPPLAAEPTSGAIADLSTNGSTAPVSLSVGQLPDFVADQASEMSAEVASSRASHPASMTKAPQAVKELDIELNPGDLGAVKLQMRLANGKLSVVISVENPKTLAAIEGERDSIASRLGGSQQELEDLTIRRQLDFAQGSQPKSSDGNSNRDSDQSNAQSRQGGDRGAGGEARNNDSSGSAAPRNGSSRSFNDLLV